MPIPRRFTIGLTLSISLLSVGCRALLPNKQTDGSITSTIVSIDTSTEEELELVKMFTHGFRDIAPRFDYLRMDQMSGSGISVLHSGPGSSSAVEEVGSRYLEETTASGDEALVEAFRQTASYSQSLDPGQRFVSIIFSAGSSNPETLAEIKAIVGTIPNNGQTQIHLFGIRPELVTTFTPLFSAIPGQSRVFTGLYADLESLLEKIHSI